jgi:hypothetical protein
MPHVTLPIDPDGYIVEVMVGLNGAATANLLAAGQPIPAPLLLRGAIDSGTDVTCVDVQVLNRFGLSPFHRLSSTTAAGVITASLYEVSFSIPRIGRLTAPLMVLDQLVVMELSQAPQGIPVLVGRDVLEHLMMITDGPRAEFTLAD